MRRLSEGGRNVSLLNRRERAAFVSRLSPLDEYEVSVLRSREEIEAAKEILAPFQRHPNADIELFLSRFADPADDSRPCVFVVLRDSEAQGMVLAMFHTVKLEMRVGYKAVLSPRVRMLSVTSGAVQGALEGAAAEALVDELMAFLRRGETDVVRFFDLDGDCDVAELAKRRPGFLCRDHIPWVGKHYAMTLTKSTDEFFRRMTKTDRRRLRRACRLIEQENPEGFSYEIFTRPDQIERFAELADFIAQRTYQWRLGASFADSPTMRRWLRILAERGQWRGYVLFVHQRPGAYGVGWLHDDTYYLYGTGFDPSFQDFHPGIGTILFAKMIEYVSEHTDARVADFGPGDYAYKRRFCDISKQTVTLLIFAPTWFGVSVNVLRTALSWTGKSASALLGWLGLRERIKRYWRNRLGEKGTG